jgi:hypothetical protein
MLFKPTNYKFFWLFNNIENFNMKYRLYILLISLFFLKCLTGNQGGEDAPPKPSHLTGKELAEIHCGSCHQQPQPDMLEKAAWQRGVLPEMEYHMGFKSLAGKLYSMDAENLPAMIESGMFPSKPIIVEEDWQKIIQYYVTNAPEKALPQPKKEPVKPNLQHFNAKNFPPTEGGVLPLITLVKIDKVRHLLYIAQRERAWVDILNSEFKKIDSIKVETSISDIQLRGEERYILEMGIMDPNDLKKGKLLKMNTQNQIETLIDSLQRPVHLNIWDINQDGTEDFIICNYGNYMGNLSWYDGKTLEENRLSSLPGARLTHIKDMNNDGLPDIVALFCQARERVSIFYNKGQNNFKEDVVLEFPPVYGSSYLDLADMTGDGLTDIIYSNGDNADYSMVLKSFHGVRIFANDGQNRFAERYFYPIHGAGKVMVRDFDKDGDLDMASIAFFPDMQQKPNEGFLFFENKGVLKFSVSTFPESARGKWLVMDVGDMDGDSFEDIIIGNFLKEGIKISKPVSLVFLKNKIKN